MKFTGIVTAGSHKASALGFPTVNITLSDAAIAGVYIGRVTMDRKEYPAAVFADPARALLEAYLLDFSDDLYGREITIELLQKIRDKETFPDEAALIQAIQADVEAVRTYFAR